MVFEELGGQLVKALRKLNQCPAVDSEATNAFLKDVTSALLQADVNVQAVKQLRDRIKAQVEQQGSREQGISRKVLQKAVIDGLVELVCSEKPPVAFERNRPSTVLFVGLQGSGKTTTCTKYADHYRRKGWRCALVCADTYRAGAFDQLKQNATRARIPFYGSYVDADPVKIAKEGVDHFIEEKFEIIIVDTSGRHRQEAALFAEMEQISAAVNPREVILVVDSHIGQACYDHAKAFGDAVGIGSVILTKMDGHAKGGGALSAVAATQAPVRFIGTGEHFGDLEPFNAKRLVSRLLGMGDIDTLFEKITTAIPITKQAEMMERLTKGKFTLRDMYTQLQSMTSMGSISGILAMLPRMSNQVIPKGAEEERMARLRQYLVAMDSMNKDELDNAQRLTDSRLLRIAKGSGVGVPVLHELLTQHKAFQKVFSKLGKAGFGKEATMKSMVRNPRQATQSLAGALDPRILKSMGGTDGMMQMLQQMQGSGLDLAGALGGNAQLPNLLSKFGSMFGGK